MDREARRSRVTAVVALIGAACGTGEISGSGAGGAHATTATVGAGGAFTTTAAGGAGGASTTTAAGGAGGASTTSGTGGDGGVAPACVTRITYGSAWIRPDGHADSFDDVAGVVDWDGSCADEWPNSYAILSNGWKPYFSGQGACVLAFDRGPSCPGAGAPCSTRIGYGVAWIPAPNHPDPYDDVAAPVLWDGLCPADGADSYASLSNGWNPHFAGHGTCSLSFRYAQCRGLYANPVVPVDCPDPGILRDGSGYVMACTSGGAPDAFPLRTSADLVHWTDAGHIFPAGKKPAWATGDYWAPEVHRVGPQYVAYYTARHQDGALSIGAATSPSATGPFTDLGHPLVHDPAMGMIDATQFEAPGGARYLVWKADGNAVDKKTPIYGQELAADGLSLVGGAQQLVTNDLGWEGVLVEGPWVVARGGQYYLFYSANFYASPAYALGVARAASPLGPYTKAPGPIVASKGAWAGPGHGSVVDTAAGDTYLVYHAWESGHVGGPPGREVLVDRVFWEGGWPSVPSGPSRRSLPLP